MKLHGPEHIVAIGPYLSELKDDAHAFPSSDIEVYFEIHKLALLALLKIEK